MHDVFDVERSARVAGKYKLNSNRERMWRTVVGIERNKGA